MQVKYVSVATFNFKFFFPSQVFSISHFTPASSSIATHFHTTMAPSITEEPLANRTADLKSEPLKAAANPSSDPSIYEAHHQQFLADGQPTSSSAWIERARQVAGIFAQDATARDIENLSPRAEIALLKSSGLLKVLGPKEYGGGGETWETGYKAIREVARGDGSLGMLLGYHLLWSTTANVVGSEEQKNRVQKLIIENNYFLGGEWNYRGHVFGVRN